MVFVDVAFLALLLGKLLGGRLTALADTPIKAPWLAFAAIGLQVIAFPSDVLPWSTPSGIARALWLVSYAFLVLMLVLNSRLVGAPVIGAGLCCNLVAVIANNGLMPVRPSALRAAGITYHVHNNSIDLARPHLAALIDRWGAPAWVPLANVFSVGDVLIGIGTILTIVVAMRSSFPREEAAGSSRRSRAGGKELGLPGSFFEIWPALPLSTLDELARDAAFVRGTCEGSLGLLPPGSDPIRNLAAPRAGTV